MAFCNTPGCVAPSPSSHNSTKPSASPAPRVIERGTSVRTARLCALIERGIYAPDLKQKDRLAQVV